MKKRLKATEEKSSHEQLKPVDNAESIPSSDILLDEDYAKMVAELQKGRWAECSRFIQVLDERYPGNPKLAEFKQEFELQFNVIKNAEASSKEKSKKTIINRSEIFLIAAGTIFILIMIFGFGFSLLQKYSAQQQILNTESQIKNLATQVESLLNSGQPEKASEIIAKMKTIDANNSLVVNLSQKTDSLLKTNRLYLSAVDKLDKGQDANALLELQQIQLTNPNYRDVSQLIENTTKKIQIDQSISNGTKAYEISHWQEAIDNFENVQTLDPSNSDPTMQGMLLNSYLHQIIQILENENTTFAEIDKAETYYRRAISMIPQSKYYLSERENLQKLSSNLLELKYAQSAQSIIQDPSQNIASINLAVNYLKKATNLDPNNNNLKIELNKMSLYQAGFQYFIGMNWPSAIEQLQLLYSMDANYASGYAKQLLYEAYISRGMAYFSVGFFPDARKQFDAAETLVSDQKNLVNFYLVEIDLAHSLGQLHDYKNGASYFKYAIETVNYSQRAVLASTFVSNLISAETLYADGSNEAAYKLFDQTLSEDSALYVEKEISVKQGACLAIIAAQNNSSVQAIISRNNLTQQTIITSDQKLIIPTMP